MDIQATLAAADVLLRTAGEHVEAVSLLCGKLYITCAASAIPALVEAGGVWSDWYGRTLDGKEQRSLDLTVEGVTFCTYEVREKAADPDAPDSSATAGT